ncbi:alpha-1,2-mannosyltransferase [Saccharopolyspora gloriosae]|uniref:Alpha-1,2-mannosyltransferase n=1 Tax=Saccharopolyspora gloriosae TaxID=455344 RepID=A0A840N7C5_9PSEU|nr:glycosyltransferase 87 family protein [Saccharopolyspora gloriosae]MBB5067544.1 alpha-1,2-mannosyltransferase [Saccharopolyspora gloriosae]
MSWAVGRPYLVCGFVFAVCAAGLVLAVRALWANPGDLEVYRAAGTAVFEGRSLYERPLVDGLYFVYPPVAGLLFLPLAPLSMGAAQAVFVVGGCLVLVCCAWWAWRAVGFENGRAVVLTALVAAGVLAFEPVYTSLHVGQINLGLMALVLWDLLRADRCRSKGVGVGLAAAIKLTPLLFVLYLVATRRFRAAGVAAGSFSGAVALGAVVLPADSARFWLTGAFADSSRMWPDAGDPQNMSLNGLLIRLMGEVGSTTVLWLGLAGMLVGRTMVLASRAGRLGEPLLGVALVGLCTAAVSPWSWAHHWVWVVPLVVFAGARLLRATNRVVLLLWIPPVALAALSVVPVLVPGPGGSADVASHSPAGWLLGDVYLILFVVALLSASGHLKALALDAASQGDTSAPAPAEPQAREPLLPAGVP